MFNLIVLQLALSEQERSFWPEEGEEIGDGRAEGSSAIDGRQVQFHSHLTLMAQVLFLAGFNSIFPLDKTIQLCLRSGSLLLIIDDTVALDCTWNGCCNLCVPFWALGLMPQKWTVPPQIKKIPLPFHALWISVVLQLLLLPFFSLGLFPGHVHIFESLKLKRFLFRGLTVYLYQCGRLNNFSPPIKKDVLMLIRGNCEYAILNHKRKFSLMSK